MTSVAQGRLGENLSSLTRRFGRPFRAEANGVNTVECTFHIRNGNFNVQVKLLNGISVAETYFSTQPLQPNGEPPVEIVRGIFQTNVPRARWMEQPVHGGHENAAFVTADGRYGAWISNNGSWYESGCTFVVAVYRADAEAPAPSGETVPTEAAPTPSATPTPLDPTVRAKLIADFHSNVLPLLTKSAAQPWLKTPFDSLARIPALPPDLSDAIQKGADDARELRRKVGYGEKDFKEFKNDTAVVDALAAFAEATRQVHSGNAAQASQTVGSFCQEYPVVPGSESKSLWKALDSLRALLKRLHEDANTHIEKASSLSDAGKKGDAIQEYQKAYDIFPDPQTAERIKALREESLGL